MKKAEETVLLYHFNEERERKITQILTEMKIKTKQVTRDMTAQKVGYLVGIKSFQRVESAPPEQVYEGEVLVFQGLDPGRIQTVLEAFKRAGIEKVAIKASVTPKNIFWPFYRLCERIQKEHGILSEAEQ